MFTFTRRLGGATALGLSLVALAVPGRSLADGLTVGQGLALTGNVGGQAFAMPGGAAGFNANLGGVRPVSNPFANLIVSPYGGPGATMTSQGLPAPYPPYPGYGCNYDPYGGYLQGVASVIDSNGRYLVSVQQAGLGQQELKRSQLQTRRAAYEEWLWERNNLPTLEDDRERVFREQLRRAQNDPPLPEIWSGDSLNVLLKSAQNLPKSIQGPNIPLDEDIISKINLNAGKGLNFGLLKNEGQLTWPYSLRELKPAADSQELRDLLQRLGKKAFNEAKLGQVDPNTIREMEKGTDRLQKLLVAQVGDLPFAQYSEGKRYLNQLYDGIKALREPNATDIANGRFKLRGNTVADVVDYMTKNGLPFAPAVAGEESAYLALQRAMAAYGAASGKLVADRPTQ
jgi:hypothetical protein